MSLKGLEEKIYKRPENSGKREGEFLAKELPASDKGGTYGTSFFRPKQDDKNAIWIKEEEEKKAKKKKIKKIALIASLSLAALALLIWGVLFLRKRAFDEAKVNVSVSGPSSVQSGDSASIEIEFKNDNWVDLKNAVLYINYSANFIPDKNLNLEPNGPNASKLNVGTVKSGTSGKLEMPGKFFGTKDLLTYIDAKLEFSSLTFSSTFQKENKLAVMITSSPITIEITGPQTVYSGGAVTYLINYKNAGEGTFAGMMVKADYPDGFSLTNSEPLPASEKNVWYVGDIGPGQAGTVKIIGSMTGNRDEIKRLKIYIGTGSGQDFVGFDQNETSTKIVESPLQITQNVNGKQGELTVNTGDVLNFTINFKNTGSVPLRDVILYGRNK